MNKEIRQQIKSIIKKYKIEALACLYPENDYTWGTKRKNLQRTIKLMNDILSEFPKELEWPKIDFMEEEESDSIYVKEGNWHLNLYVIDGKRSANLAYSKDDHTAWVIENKSGKFVDYDIGGS